MNHPMLDFAEWNFSYLEEYEHLKRSAVLYEYGRENRDLVGWILHLREFGLFGISKKNALNGQGSTDMIRRRIHREVDMISFNELLFLTSLKHFPDRPFQLALEQLDPQVCKYVNGGIISEPLKQMREIPDGAWFRSDSPSNVGSRSTSRAESTHIFAIPWEGTSNDELASQFRAWLDAHRPKQFSASRKKGRNSGASAGANHKLHQLGAYRLHHAGISREQAKAAGFVHYSSEHAWSRAVSEAGARIKQVYTPESVEPSQ